MNSKLITLTASILFGFAWPSWAEMVSQEVLGDITRKSGGEVRQIMVGQTADRIVLTTSQAKVQVHQIIVVTKDGYSLTLDDLAEMPQNQVASEMLESSDAKIHYLSGNKEGLPAKMELLFEPGHILTVLVTLESWGGYADVKLTMGMGPVDVAVNDGPSEEPNVGQTCSSAESLTLREQTLVCRENNLSVRQSLNSVLGELERLQAEVGRQNSELNACMSDLNMARQDSLRLSQSVQASKADVRAARQSLRAKRLKFKYVRNFPSTWTCWARPRNSNSEFWGQGPTPGQALAKAIDKCARSDEKDPTKHATQNACAGERWHKYDQGRNGDIPRVGCTYKFNHKMVEQKSRGRMRQAPGKIGGQDGGEAPDRNLGDRKKRKDGR